MAVRVLIVDDHEPFRQAARDVIASTPAFVMIGEAATGESSVEAAGRLDPDLVLMDVVLPGIDGIEAARQIHQRSPRTVVLLLSTYARADFEPRLADAGATAFVAKSDFGPRLLAEAWAAAQAADESRDEDTRDGPSRTSRESS
jgi:DNA-binding NarL/FixJ family response regulator